MNDVNLDQIVESVRNYLGLVRKKPIKAVVEKLYPTQKYGNALPNFGDDAAVIPFKDEYLLFATDGMMTGLIINELISNSLKYAFPEDRSGKISVSMEKVDNEFQLTVMDNGIGMSKDLDLKN